MNVAELEEIRKRTLKQISPRKGEENTRVVVGMATCGIAAGAGPVMLAFLEETNKRALKQVAVSQTGCIGVCRLEPMVDVLVPGKKKVTYVRMTPEKAARVVAEHIVNGRPVEEYTIAHAESVE